MLKNWTIYSQTIFILLISVAQIYLGWYVCNKYHQVKARSVKEVTVVPEVKVVKEIVKVPEYITKYQTRIVTVNNKIVQQIVITTENAVPAANDLQHDVSIFETDDIKVDMEEYTIEDGVPPEELKLKAKLHRLEWDMTVKNNYIKADYKDHGISVGLSYDISDGDININVSKELITIPFINAPLNIGLSYSTK